MVSQRDSWVSGNSLFKPLILLYYRDFRDKGQHGLRNSGIHVSEQSLPEKLTQALKALRPGVLSQSSSGSSPFVSKVSFRPL